MVYIIWAVTGFVVAMFAGAGPRRRAYRTNSNGAFLAGVFGGLVGGIVGDGIPHAFAGEITMTSIIGAVIGSIIFCWAIRERAEDVER